MPDKLSVAEARQAAAIGREVVLQGWVRTRRDSKAGFSFLEINDGSCFGNVQVIAESSLPNYETEIKRLSPGCSIAVTGLVKPSPGKGQATEVQATAVAVQGMADAATYPLQKKGHSFEFLRTIAHLRPRTNTFGADRPGAELRVQLDPPVLSGARLPLRPHADHHRQRLRRGGGDVPGHDAQAGKRAEKG